MCSVFMRERKKERERERNAFRRESLALGLFYHSINSIF